MKAFAILVLAFLAVCILPSALAVQCYLCSDTPFAFPGVSKCDSNDVKNITSCSDASESCMTTKIKLTTSPEMLVSRNCTSGMSCDPQSNNYICKMMNSSELTYCEARCCQGNLCDPYASSTTTIPQPTAAASTLPAASFGTFVAYFALNMFVWFN